MTEFFACDQFAAALQQDGKDFDGLAAQVEPVPQLEEVTRLRTELKRPEVAFLTSEQEKPAIDGSVFYPVQ